jgi:hypothetical protein
MIREYQAINTNLLTPNLVLLFFIYLHKYLNKLIQLTFEIFFFILLIH